MAPSAPAASGWPYVARSLSEPVFGPDGTVYFLAARRGAGDEDLKSIVALDASGHAKPGWPFDARGSDLGEPAVSRDGSVYFEACGGLTSGCVVHRLGPDGGEIAGWPFEFPSDTCRAGWLCVDSFEFGPDGTAYVSTWRQAGGGLQVYAIDTSGRLLPGWPVVPDARGTWWSNAQVGSDGTLFIARAADGSSGSDGLAAFGRDGQSRRGWPVSVPPRTDYLLGPAGSVITWSLIDDTGELCSNPGRTLFNVLGADGAAMAGWPRGSKGYASNPAVDADGTVYYVSALDNVYAHDRSGQIVAGWPVRVPGANNGCGPTPPYLGPDGTVYVLGAPFDSLGEVAALAPDGGSRPGWPYEPAGDLNLPCFDQDCLPRPTAPAFGLDGTVYLVVYQSGPGQPALEVIALDRAGQLKPGWPYRLPIDAASVEVGSLTLSPAGRLFVRSGYDTEYFLLALDPAGRVSS